MNIDAVLDQLLSNAMDALLARDIVAAEEAIIAARERAETWGATVEPIRGES